jgi:transcriptional regulator with XRE-family HTH domain
MSLGEILKQLRKERGLTQERLAKELSYIKSTLQIPDKSIPQKANGK